MNGERGNYRVCVEQCLCGVHCKQYKVNIVEVSVTVLVKVKRMLSLLKVCESCIE